MLTIKSYNKSSLPGNDFDSEKLFLLDGEVWFFFVFNWASTTNKQTDR